MDLIVPEDQGIPFDQLQFISSEMPVIAFDFRVLNLLNETRVIQWIMRGMYDSNDRIWEYQAVGQDITEQKEAAITLRQSEARYRAVVEDQTDLICRFLPDGTLTFANEAYCRHFGKTRKDLLGKSFLPLIPGADLPIALSHLDSLTPDNPTVTYEYRIVNHDGKSIWQQ